MRTLPVLLSRRTAAMAAPAVQAVIQGLAALVTTLSRPQSLTAVTRFSTIAADLLAFALVACLSHVTETFA
jgi:hypothetical protein